MNFGWPHLKNNFGFELETKDLSQGNKMVKNNIQRNIKTWAICPGQRQIKNVGINVPAAVQLNRPLEKHAFYLKPEGQMLFWL